MDTMEFIDGIKGMQEFAINSISSDQLSEVVDIILEYRPLVVTFGNGGSFAIAEHLSNDLLPVGVPSITLGSNQAILTAIANDVSYEDAPTIEMLNFCVVEAPLLLITFSVSGTSKNIVKLNSYFGSCAACVGNYLVCGPGSIEIKNTKIIQVSLPETGIIKSVPQAKYWICETTFAYIAHLIAGLVRIRLIG